MFPYACHPAGGTLPDSDSMSQTHDESFDTFVAHLMAVLPDLDEQITNVRYQNGQLIVVRNTDIVEVAVEPFERAYRRRPDALDAVVQTLLRVSKGEKGVPDPGYQAIASMIIPQLKPIVLLSDILDRGAEPIIYSMFLADVIITYAIHDGKRLSYLTEAQLERWGVSELAVHEQAIANLRARSANVPYHVAGSGSQQVIIFNHNDGLDAARILLPDMLVRAAQHIPGEILIGIPNRDFLVMFSDDDPDRVSAVALQITRDVRQHAHGISEKLFTIVDGEVREYSGV